MPDSAQQAPFWDRHRILYNFPERHKELVKYKKQELQLMNEGLQAEREAGAQNQYALNELIFQTGQMAATMDRAGGDIVQSIEVLEIALGRHLSEIRSALGHIDDKLGQMLKVLLMPLGTQAHELTVDGCKALSRGFVEQARKCFERALEHKLSDYWALTMLGFSLLEMKEAESAIKAFTEAAAFVPDEEKSEVPAQALENLARAYYEHGDFEKAHEFAERALTTREIRCCPDLNSEFAFSVYCFLSDREEEGLRRVAVLCEEDPRYTVTYESAKELEPFKNNIRRTLAELARMRHAEGEELRTELETTLDSSVRPIHSTKPQFVKEYSRINDRFERASSLLERQDLSHSILALSVLPLLCDACQELQRLAGFRETLQDARVVYDQARDRCDRASTEYSDSRERFERNRRDTIKKTKGAKKTTKTITITVLVAAGILWLSRAFNGANTALDKLFVIIIIIPLMIVIYLLFSYLLGGLVTYIADKAAESKIRDVQRQEFDGVTPTEEIAALHQAELMSKDLESHVHESEEWIAANMTRIDILLATETV